MLSNAQIDYFATFGFVVLRDVLAEHTAILRAEVDTALRDAYAATYNERVIDGISVSVPRTHPTRSCDESVLADEAAEDLIST